MINVPLMHCEYIEINPQPIFDEQEVDISEKGILKRLSNKLLLKEGTYWHSVLLEKGLKPNRESLCKVAPTLENVEFVFVGRLGASNNSKDYLSSLGILEMREKYVWKFMIANNA